MLQDVIIVIFAACLLELLLRPPPVPSMLPCAWKQRDLK
jgi:hypothetical protein